MEIHFYIIGSLLVLLAIVHIIFPKYFNWKEELEKLSLMNHQMMKVHTFFIGLTVFLMGILLLTSTRDLLTTQLGKTIILGFAIFWTIRFFMQLFVYSSQLWKGKLFETVVHIFFTFLWLYMSIVFGIVSMN
ncbi:hypothetical protein [uncultured Tenacibaculum sp.]|uniref:hypothetical protein n=1 Tax=uncultured Tenacibaculum sp. TaxID=174713 RepID=UPI00260BF688|nr:hypothetical protein [uncultured Tenacibaculum sp.]